MRHLLGARFNAELESVYKRAFNYVVARVGDAFNLLSSAPSTAERVKPPSALCENVNGSALIQLPSTSTRLYEGSRAGAVRRQVTNGAQCNSAKSRPRSRSSDAALLAAMHQKAEQSSRTFMK